jgi:hypothetical protein
VLKVRLMAGERGRVLRTFRIRCADPGE